MLNRTLHTLSALLVMALLLVGCDSSGTSSEPLDVTAEETAESIALATATETGGTLDDAEDAATVSSVLTNAMMGPSASMRAQTSDLAQNHCGFNNDEVLWSCSFSVERSSERAEVAFSRDYEIQFLDANGDPMPFFEMGGETAASITLDVLSGWGSVQTRRVVNSYTINTSSWTLSDLTETSATLSGTASRSMADTLTTQNAEHTRIADVEMEMQDLVWVQEEGPENGTISGTYSAEVTITRDGETATRTVNASYTITFADGEGEITFTAEGSRFNGESFRFDVDTGELIGTAS